MDVNQIIAEHGTTIVGVVILLIIASFVWKLFKPKQKVIGEGMTLNVRCRTCSWQGTVTKYNQTCRKCGGTDLQDLGK